MKFFEFVDYKKEGVINLQKSIQHKIQIFMERSCYPNAMFERGSFSFVLLWRTFMYD
jgi:hypothetical protein